MDTIHQLEHTLHNLASPKRAHTFWGLLAVLAVCAGLIWLKHGEWLAKPNENMLGAAPDGIKNYMTSLWHVRHDSGYVHYEGMNYPFGEHVLFTDNQPLLSAAMQWWSRHVASLDGKTVSVINVFQVISLLLGCAVLFLLLRKLHVPVWYAGVVSLGMLFLSPQNSRFDGHFALSHTWVFPLLLLLLVNYEERYSRRYQSLLIGILMWVAAQFHFYYFGLSALFLTLYTAFQLIRDFSVRNWRVRLSHLAVMILFPFVLLNIWLHWSDFVTDRPANPYGFTHYIGQWEGVLLPYESFPLYQWIDKNIVPIRRVNGETQAYAGILALFFTLWYIVLFFKWLLFQLTKKRLFVRHKIFPPSWSEAAYHRVHERYLHGIFAAVFVLFLFSCGLPFIIPGLEWMVDYFGPLRQFRGLGRFTWAYFYVANILIFYWCWNRSIRFKGFGQNRRAPWFRWVIALAPAAVLCWEAWTFQRLRPLQPIPSLERPNIAAPGPEHWLNKVNFDPYQALLPLPYYHLGSENIWWDIDYSHFIHTQTTALHTGKPDMGVNLSRTSCSQTVISAQFVLEPCVTPAMLNQLPDNRPLAVLIPTSRWDEVRGRYPHLIAKAETAYEGPEMKVLTLYPDSVRAYVQTRNRGVETERRTRPLTPWKNWQTTRPTDQWWYVSFDSLTPAKRIFQGKSAYSGTMSDTTWLLNSTLPKGLYTVSFWLFANQDQGMNHDLKIGENSTTDGREIHFRHEGLRFHLKSIVDNWALYELGFEVHEDNARMRLFLHKENINQPFYLDELLIKPMDVEVYRREADWVIRNNFWYHLD